MKRWNGTDLIRIISGCNCKEVIRCYKTSQIEISDKKRTRIVQVKEEIIDDVFKNRGEYSEKRYIDREFYEREISRALKRYSYVFITGESGSGKTWLATYILSKKVYNIVNLSDVKLNGGFYDYFKNNVPEILEERTETMGARANIGVASGGAETSRTYAVNSNYFREFLRKNKNSVVVFDNFESIVNDEIMLDELSCIITMADDPLILNNNIRFVVISATGTISKYFDRMPNYQTIASRIQTVPVKGFNATECYNFITKTFRECGFKVPYPDEISSYLMGCTAGMPQSINEICYYIALSYFDENKEKILVNDDTFKKGQMDWANKRLGAEFAIIRGLYRDNIEKGHVALNHVLYYLKDYDKKDFSSSQIYACIDEHSKQPVKGLSKTGVKQYLTEIADDLENRNLLEKKGPDLFRIKSYKSYACIKLVLTCDEDRINLIDYFQDI